MTGERSEAVLKQLQTLFNEGTVGALTDGELLDRFVRERGEPAEAAFAALVERHAPMVHAGLPATTGRRPRRPGRLPGDFPRVSKEGALDPAA